MTTCDLMRWVNVRVGDELYERIKAAADADRRSLSNWIAFACEEKLARTERERTERERGE
jgi:predicted HicB family RNase H-like nuclease